jgi:histone-lysine N-methyltransferase SETD2
VLQPFLKEDCKLGHIQNTDDFKHLARKFTHMIMEKEMSRATKIEELDLNKRIKMKTQEFITRYMQRFNGNYSRKTDDQN